MAPLAEVLHWVQHWTGWQSGQGNDSPYLFWSGFEGDLVQVALLGGLVQVIRHHNCSVKGCWRPGRHAIADGQFRACARHHPGIDHREVITPEVLARHHEEHEAATGR